MLFFKICAIPIFLYTTNCVSQTQFNYSQKEIWFDNIIGQENSGLINGPEYFIPFQGFKTNPFFGSLKETNEKLRIDEMDYYNVPLLYDCYSDVLVLRIKNKSNLFAMLQLDKNRIQSFSLQGHQFQKMTNNISSKANQDFYDVLYQNKNLSLVSKRSKISFVEDRQRKYKTRDKYYLIYNGQWKGLSKYRDFFQLKKTHKQVILEFIHHRKIKTRAEAAG